MSYSPNDPELQGSVPPPPAEFPPPDDTVLPPVSPTEPLVWGWRAFARESGTFVGATLVWWVIAVAVIAAAVMASGIMGSAGSDGTFSSLSILADAVVSAGCAVPFGLASAAFVRVGLGVTRGRPASFGDFFSFTQGGPAVVTALILGAINVVLDLVPFARGGTQMLVGFLFLFVYFVLLDTGVGPIDAIRGSIRLVWANRRVVGLFFLITVAIWFAALLTCGLGLIVAVPWVLLSTAYLYRRLTDGYVVVAS